MQPPTLTDGVVVLDALTRADAEAHLRGEDDEIARRFGWYPARSSLDGVMGTIDRWDEDWQNDAPRRALAVRLAAGGALVGGVEVRIRTDDPEIAEASYWTLAAFRRRGYATRALALLSEFAFERPAVRRIELYVEPDNHASRSVAGNCGYAEEGLAHARVRIGQERRDMLVYSRITTKDEMSGELAPMPSR